MIRLAERVHRMKPSATLTLAAKAKELADSGRDVISLTVGEPDWDTYDFIKTAAVAAMQKGATKYTPPSGILDLKKTIAEVTHRQLGANYSASEVTVTAGSKFIIFAALQVLVQPGDEVIIPAPYWVSYPTMVELAGATAKIISCTAKSAFKLTAPLLESAITDRTQALILNSPSNPTGEFYTQQELIELAKVLERHPQVTVISDDIYNQLVFDGVALAPHLLHVQPALKERMIVVNGVSKTYAMTGWRVGWALGPQPVIKAMTDYQSQSISCACDFAQVAAVAALKNGDSEVRATVKKLMDKRNLVVDELSQIEHLKMAKPAGAFYAWPDITWFMGGTWQGQPINNSAQFAKILLEEFNVAVVPGVEFGLEGFLRLSFVSSAEKIREASRRLRTFCQAITK